MILGVLFVLALLTVPLFGGTVSRLGEIRITHIPWVVASLALQVLIVSVAPSSLPIAAAAALHLMSYGLALVFVWHNRRIPGMTILVAGGLLNLAAIAANGGVMPAAPEALALAGKETSAAEFDNSAPTEGARLQILGDIFAVPDGYPFANVFSIGDVLLVLGGAILVHKAGGSALARRGAVDVRKRLRRHVAKPTESYALSLLAVRRRRRGCPTDQPFARRRLRTGAGTKRGSGSNRG